MDYDTLDILFNSRKTLLKILAGRGFNTKPFDKFGPFEIAAMAAAVGPTHGMTAFRMDLERPADVAAKENGLAKCRVEYVERVKNRIARFMDDMTDKDENEDAVNPETTELIVITLEPVVEVFHATALTHWMKSKLRVSFFQAHTIVNNPLEHVLQPKFEIVPATEHNELLKQLNAKKSNFPLIRFHEDMVSRLLGLVPGDMVRIIRPSVTAGEYVSYRVCAP